MLKSIVLVCTLGVTFFTAPAFAVTCGGSSGTPITRCETISKSGQYCLANNILQSGSGDCLVISAPNVTVVAKDTYGYGVGSGSGAAIHILSTATHFSFATAFVNHPVGGYIGVQDDANYAYIGLGGSDAPSSLSGTSYGIYANHVTGSTFVPGQVSGGIAGLWIYGGGKNYITTEQSPGGPSGSSYGNTYGIHLQGSTGNLIYSTIAGANPNTGQAIFMERGSSGNLIYQNIVQQAAYGIRVKYDSPSNFITDNQVKATYYDFFQGTSSTSPTVGCYGDFWLNNIATGSSFSANQSCID